MKARLVLIIAVFAITLTTWLAISFFSSQKKVSFILEDKGYSIHIINEHGKKVKELNTSQEVILHTGKYFYVVAGDMFNGKTTPFTVEDDSEITVQAKYTEKYLIEVKNERKKAVLVLLESTYPNVGNITITDFSLSDDLYWLYGKLQLKNSSDVFRFIVKQDKEVLSVYISPRIIITKNEAINVPEEIIYSLY